MKTEKWKNEIPNIKTMGVKGMTLRQIGAHYGVTGAYIWKLIKQHKIFNDYEIWGKKVSRLNKEKTYFLKHGIKEKTDLYKAKKRKFTLKKHYALSNGIEFTVNFGELNFPDYCPALGIELDYFASDVPKDNSPSFDRIDPLKGYVTGNVIIISNKANRIKNNANYHEIKMVAEFVKTLLVKLL